MEEWYCFKCKEKMIEKEVEATYMEMTTFIDGIKCPKCRETYLTEEVAVKIVRKGEEDVETKLG